MPSVVSGTGEAALNVAIREHFNPGDRLMVEVALPRALTNSELQYVGDSLAAKGIPIASASVLNATSNPTLTLLFTNPPSTKGFSAIAFLPVIAVLAEIGITALLAWQVSKISVWAWWSMMVLAAAALGIGWWLYKQGKKQRA